MFRKPKNHKNRNGFRRCSKCNEEFPLTIEFFQREKTRSQGFGYRCKPCMKIISAAKPKRHFRYENMTPSQKSSKRAAQLKNYRNTPKSVHRVRSYKAIDKRKGQTCDLDPDWYEENIQGKPCEYCGDGTRGVGCDRISNRFGHTKANVVPCCLECNIIKGDRFTYDEMLIIGHGIRKVRCLRSSKNDANYLQVRSSFEAGKPFV